MNHKHETLQKLRREFLAAAVMLGMMLGVLIVEMWR
jgi:hypothetical protein